MLSAGVTVSAEADFAGEAKPLYAVAVTREGPPRAVRILAIALVSNVDVDGAAARHERSLAQQLAQGSYLWQQSPLFMRV